jgi:hypothetical protein
MPIVIMVVFVLVLVVVVVWGALLPKLEGDFLKLRGHHRPSIAMYFPFSGEA